MTPGYPPSGGRNPLPDVETIAQEPSPKVSQEDPAALIRHRRRVRMARFIVCEAVAIAVMVFSALAGISARFAAENFTPVFRVLPVSAAVVAVVLPIIFFGDPKRRNRPRRREAKKASG
jgi:hypothetical protein